MNAWIARDLDGELWLFDTEPDVCGSIFVCSDSVFVFQLPTELYPEVTFENSPIELVIKS